MCFLIFFIKYSFAYMSFYPYIHYLLLIIIRIVGKNLTKTWWGFFLFVKNVLCNLTRGKKIALMMQKSPKLTKPMYQI